MLSDALTGGEKRRVRKFSRGSWVPVWPPGGAMFAYMFSHEAHHRGQILMLARQSGYRIPRNVWGADLAQGSAVEGSGAQDATR